MLRIKLVRLGRRNLASFGIIISENANLKIQDKIGYYNPSLKDQDPYRMYLDREKYEEYIKKGAQPTERVKLIAYKLGYIEKPEISQRPNKSTPKKKAQERIKN